MVNLKLMTVAMIVVLQMCTANPISSKEENDSVRSEEEDDPAKLFTADELQRASNAGIPVRALVVGKSDGLTVEEMIKLHALKKEDLPEAGNLTFKVASKVCEIFVPGHKMASNYTSAQEEELRYVAILIFMVPMKEQLTFFRTSVCAFISQPNLYPFDPKFIPHAKIRFLKRGFDDATGLDRVKVAKQMCCIDEGGNILDNTKLNGLPDEEMNEFDEQWNNFETTNVPESIKKLCDFLHAKSSADDDQCQKVVPVVDENKIHS